MEKINKDRLLSPGPGSYAETAQTTRVKSPSAAFSKSTRYQQKQSDGPGPGNYSFAGTTSGPSFSMKGRANDKIKDDKPGPGQYSTEYKKSGVAAYKMSKGSRTEVVQKSSKEQPGPGNYKYEEKWGSKGYTMQGKRNEKLRDNSPGPAQYTQDSSYVKTRSIGATLKGSPRKAQKESDHPGPGGYDYYEKTKGPSYTMTGKKSEKYREGPGPGQYEAKDQVTKTKSVTYKMGSSTQREAYYSKSQLEQPGPGTYEK